MGENLLWWQEAQQGHIEQISDPQRLDNHKKSKNRKERCVGIQTRLKMITERNLPHEETERTKLYNKQTGVLLTPPIFTIAFLFSLHNMLCHG